MPTKARRGDGAHRQVPSGWARQSEHLGPSHPNVLELVSGEMDGSQYPVVWVLELTPKEAAKNTEQVRARLRKKAGYSLSALGTPFSSRLLGLHKCG